MAWKRSILNDGSIDFTDDQSHGDNKITSVKSLDFTDFSELTIATGAITVTQACHTVDTEGDAASDDLVTINGGTNGLSIVLRAENAARTVVVKHNTGNIWLQGKVDINLDDLEDGILLYYDGIMWFDIAAGGAGGGDTGTQGDTGVQGNTGIQGDSGAAGSQGDTGDAGGQGNTGVQGDTGAKGDTGSAGAKGDTGTEGDTGITGQHGDTGVQGDTGEQGDTGAGSQGDTGATGSQGNTGVQGDTGTEGDTGAGTQGDTGDQGDTGIQGNTGVQGDTGVGGGLYGINVETLADAKTLTPGTDEIYQYLDPDGANRIITLATAGATAGDRFVLRHNGAYNDTYYLEVKQGATSLDKIYAANIKGFIFDGTNWITLVTGTGENDNKVLNVGIGQLSQAQGEGTALGYKTTAYTQGVAIGGWAYGLDYSIGIGYSSEAYTHSVGIGHTADAHDYSVGIGDNANATDYGVAVGDIASADHYSVAIGACALAPDKYSIALGYYSRCTRYGETSINIDGNSAQKNNVVQGRWSKATADATPVEMFCGGVASQRFTIRAKSALAFKINVVARDNVAGHVAMYLFEGLIKRDASNNTVLSICNKTIIYEDDAAWDVAVTADDTNEALIITVTGDGTNPTQFAAVLDGVETHF